MHHRGPDDGGSFAADGVWLGHRRLAIIDLSPLGHQPLTDPETGATIVFNGEIFNYLELRAELEGRGHRFRGHSDTEVLLRAYLEWGSACLPRLNGMWAFVIWDPRRREAFFSRDRFGIKPLFMAQVDGALALASEAKALLELYPQLRRPDVRSIARLLAEKRVYADGRSFYESVSVFPPAHAGIFAPGDRAPRLQSFWSFPPEAGGEADFAAGEREFDELFADAVALRLRSDVPVGMTLSGGLDSTAILHAAMGGLAPGHGLTAYTAAFADTDRRGRSLDERGAARAAAAPYGGCVLREVPAAVDDLLEVLRRVVWHMDGPGFSPAVFPVWRIMEELNGDGTRVVLEGQGADELLGGYSNHVAAVLLDTGRRAARELSLSALVAALRIAAAVPGAFGVRRVAGDVAVELFEPVRAWDRRRSTVVSALAPELVPVRPAVAPVDPGTVGHLRRRLLADFCLDRLPAFLHYGDALSMAHSVESRLPFLDHRLVELAFRLPAGQMLRGGPTKALVRGYLRRAGHVDQSAARRKRGFPTPSSDWLAREGGALLREVLLDPGAATRPYLEPRALEPLIDRHASGMVAAGDVLFGLLSTELWLQECVLRPGAPRASTPPSATGGA